MSLPSVAGAFSGVKVLRGALIEYTMGAMPVLEFEFNPQSITRTRSVQIKQTNVPGTSAGYGFSSPSDSLCASQGVVPAPETLEITIMLDATDRMNDGDPVASQFGVQPEIDLIRTMLEPKCVQPSGARVLAALTTSAQTSFPNHQTASVLIFRWGVTLLPVFLTSASIDAKAYLPNLFPYRAEAKLTMQVIESDNPFYNREIRRISMTAMLNWKTTMESMLMVNV